MSAIRETHEKEMGCDYERPKQQSEAITEGKEPQHRGHPDRSDPEEIQKGSSPFGASFQFQVQTLAEARHDVRTPRTSPPERVRFGSQGSKFRTAYLFFYFSQFI